LQTAVNGGSELLIFVEPRTGGDTTSTRPHRAVLK
jgi:hypothetical protein